MAGTLLRFASGLRGLRISWLTVGIRLLDPVCPNENDATLPRNPSGKSCARFEIRTRVRLASTCRGFRSPGIMRHSSYSVYRPQCLDPTKRLSPSRVYLPAVRKASTTWSESERNVLAPPRVVHPCNRQTPQILGKKQEKAFFAGRQLPTTRFQARRPPFYSPFIYM